MTDRDNINTQHFDNLEEAQEAMKKEFFEHFPDAYKDEDILKNDIAYYWRERGKYESTQGIGLLESNLYCGIYETTAFVKDFIEGSQWRAMIVKC